MTKEIYRYLKPFLYFMGFGLFIFTISRLIFSIVYRDRTFAIDNWYDIFINGFRIDMILLSLSMALPFLLVSFLPKKAERFLDIFFTYYFNILLLIFLFLEFASLPFIKQYDTRPNKLFINYLIYPKEVFNTISKGFWLESLIGIVVLVLMGIVLFKKAKKWFYTDLPLYKVRLWLFPMLGFLLFFGIRSSLISVRPYNAKDIIFSNDLLVNNLSLNSTYSLGFAIYNMQYEDKMDYSSYGSIDTQEAINRVKKYMNVDEKEFISKNIPLLHTQYSSNPTKPYNIVIFLQESLGAEYVGHLGGKPLTPNLDSLAKEGMYFTNLFCTGTRSIKGIESVLTGFLPHVSTGVLRMEQSQENFFTLAQLLKNKGYNTSFIYGGQGSFDNMGPFFLQNGFEKIIDENHYKNYAFKGTWGVSDEDLVLKANEYYKSQGDKPFFSLMFSSSNHEPFEFPDGRIQLYEKPKNSVHNAMKYADFAIGKFFQLAKKEKYFQNTIFIVIADHDTRVYGSSLIPLNKFRIPGVIIAPNVKPNTAYTKLCSQIDIAPTLLDLAGFQNIAHPMPGRNVLQLPVETQGRTITEFNGVYGFRVENNIVILQNGKKPLQFKVKNDTTLLPLPLNQELYKDAISHLQLSSYLLQNKKYNLNKK